MRRLTRGTAVTALGCAAVLTGASLAQAESGGPANDESGASLNAAFSAAAERYDVPRDVLAALAYAQSRLANHDGKPSQDNGFGLMHLESNPDNDNLEDAARLTDHSVEELKTDPAANIDGAAAVLSRIADDSGLTASARNDLARWYVPLAQYSRGHTKYGAKLEADAVFSTLRDGFSSAQGGERVTLRSNDVRPQRGAYAGVRTAGSRGAASDDYPDAEWVEADSANYESASRGADDISSVVVHVTQGSYSGTISWFQNPEAQVSAHYVVQSSDGEVTQMVRDKDVAWHARDANSSSVGIEHEGYVDDPEWFTDVMYQSSADLTAHLADEYDIPKDREHIVGHSEVPGNDHTDPGPNWDWDLYMSYVSG